MQAERKVLTVRRFIFLTSSSFSGSTLLAFMLGAHPSIATVSELTGLIESIDSEDYVCSCGNLLAHCSFWNSISIRMRRSHEEFSINDFKTRYKPLSQSVTDKLQFSDLRYNSISYVRDYIYQQIPRYRDHLRSITKRNIDLSNHILEFTNKDIFFDASKEPNRIRPLKQALECEFKVIHLVKDGRGVFDSFKRHYPQMPDYEAILGWQRVNRLAERALTYLDKSDRYRLRYEDLVSNTAYELAKLCEFIGVEYSPRCLDFRDSEHHIIGNTKMRLASSNEIYQDEKWKRTLSVEQLTLFNRLAGKMQKKYDYS